MQGETTGWNHFHVWSYRVTLIVVWVLGGYPRWPSCPASQRVVACIGKEISRLAARGNNRRSAQHGSCRLRPLLPSFPATLLVVRTGRVDGHSEGGVGERSQFAQSDFSLMLRVNARC